MFRMVKLTSTADAEKRSRIQEVLRENDIAWKVKAKDLYQKNPLDISMSGVIGMNRVKISYEFYVDRRDLDLALGLVKGIL